MKIVNDGLLASFRQKPRCEWCGQPTPRGCAPHHYYQRKGMGGGQRLDHSYNLVALCMQCHEDAHVGKIAKWDFLALVAAREGSSQQTVEMELLRLRRIHR